MCSALIFATFYRLLILLLLLLLLLLLQEAWRAPLDKHHSVFTTCAAIEREANRLNGFAEPKLHLRACNLNKRGVKLSTYVDKCSNSIECAQARRSQRSEALFMECLASLADSRYSAPPRAGELKVHAAMRAAIDQAVKQY